MFNDDVYLGCLMVAIVFLCWLWDWYNNYR